MILSHHQRLQLEVRLKLPVTTLSYYSTCTTPLCYKSIDIEVSISILILLRQSIDIGIDDTFKADIDIEYRRYFWKISIITLVLSLSQTSFMMIMTTDAESLFFVGLRLQDVMCDLLIVCFRRNGEKNLNSSNKSRTTVYNGVQAKLSL